MITQSQSTRTLRDPVSQSLINKLQSITPLDVKIDRKQQHHIEGDQFKKRYKENAIKISLPSLPSMKLKDSSSLAQMIYNNNLRLPPRLPKLETQPPNSPKERKKHSSMDSFLQPTSFHAKKALTPEKDPYDIEPQKPPAKKKQSFKSLIKQVALRTKAGCMANKLPKTNQDAAIISPKNLESIGYNLFSICDGHGTNGHIVSNFIKQQLPKHLTRFLKDQNDIKENIIKAFLQTNKEIWQSEVDTTLSGSTCVSLLIAKNKIISANVGDSRAIMCRQLDGGWRVIELSIDHKPNNEREKKKILDFGGRVDCQKDQYGNPIGPDRVWLSYIDAPGLAMTRSLGDKVGAQAGVIAEPEILEFDITPDDKFLIVASDGVWEYLSNEDVMNIVLPYFEKDNIEQAAERLLAESVQSWRKVFIFILKFTNQQSFTRDDITCIVLFLQN